MAGEGRWGDPAAREQWVREWVADPSHLQRKNSNADWVGYQRAHAGDYEVLLISASGKPVWADGLVLDAETNVVAVDAKFVDKPNQRSMYEGGRPEFLLRDFDAEMVRYAGVIANTDNPVSELRIVASTEKAAEFLGARARDIMGPDVSLNVRVELTAPGEAPTPTVTPAPPSADLAPSPPKAPMKAPAGGLPMELILERELSRMTDAQVAEVARKAVEQYPYGRPPWMAPLERRVQMPPPKPVPGTEVYPTPAEMKATLKAAVAKMSPDEIAVASTKARALHPHGQFPDWMEPLTEAMPPLPPPPPPPPISPESMEASQRAADSVKRNWPNASEAADRAPMPKRRSAPRPKPAKALGKVLRRK